MQLAIWNYPPAEFAVSGFTSGWVPPPFEIVRHTIPECVQLLAAGRVDVAMVPTLTLLRDPDAYDVLPAVALSSWSYPYARLVLRHGLQGEIERLAFNPVAEQEAFLARLVLKEHYQRQPVMVPLEGASHLDLLRSDADAALIVGVDAPLLHSDALWLDLGQEWYELANYPMVWGFFATRKGEATPAVIRAIRNNVDAAEEQRALCVIDIKRTVIETPEEVARRIELAAGAVGAERIRYVHPDCGFWMLKRNIADGKMRALVAGRDLFEGRA